MKINLYVQDREIIVYLLLEKNKKSKLKLKN